MHSSIPPVIEALAEIKRDTTSVIVAVGLAAVSLNVGITLLPVTENGVNHRAVKPETAPNV